MCFEKPSDIRIWLVQSNLKATLGLCIEASAALPFPLGECSLRKKGLTNSQSESLHRAGAGLWCKLLGYVFHWAISVLSLCTKVSLGLLYELWYEVGQKTGRHRAAADLCTALIKPSHLSTLKPRYDCLNSESSC